MDTPVVALDCVSAGYEGERTATLHNVSFQVRQQQRIVIVGPNGAGKTTLLEVINGLLPVSDGQVHVFGKSVAHHGRWLRARIAYMAQELFFQTSTPFLVQDVVLMALFGQIGLFRRPQREHRRRAFEALEAVGMASLRHRPIGRLSGGQQRKVLLARAIAQQARLLLLDEPTANLDAFAKQDVADLVADIEQALDATALIVSHEQGPLTDGAQRVLRIEAGRITCPAPVTPAQALVLQGI